MSVGWEKNVYSTNWAANSFFVIAVANMPQLLIQIT